MNPWSDDRPVLSTPPPDVPCLVCDSYTTWATTSTPRGIVWQCRRCLSPVDAQSFEFDPQRAPQGREEGTAAIRVLQQMVVGLRHSQDGPVDPDDLYELCRPYFSAGWCVRDILYALNQQPNGTTHPDNGWSDRLPRKQLLYRVQRRLREWRWVDRDQDDDIMAGGWSEMRRTMTVVAQRQAAHAQARAEEWNNRRDLAQRATNSYGRHAARQAAMSAAARARAMRAQAQQREQLAAAETARQAQQQRLNMQRLLDGLGQHDDEDDW
jgi:hypothetical protein